MSASENSIYQIKSKLIVERSKVVAYVALTRALNRDASQTLRSDTTLQNSVWEQAFLTALRENGHDNPMIALEAIRKRRETPHQINLIDAINDTLNNLHNLEVAIALAKPEDAADQEILDFLSDQITLYMQGLTDLLTHDLSQPGTPAHESATSLLTIAKGAIRHGFYTVNGSFA